MERVSRERLSEKELEQHFEERERYKDMYQEIVRKSWLDKVISDGEDEELPSLIDEDSDEDNDEESSSEESSNAIDKLPINEETNEEDLKYNSLVTKFNEDRNVCRRELGNCRKKRCRRNRKYVSRVSQEEWKDYLERNTKKTEVTDE